MELGCLLKLYLSNHKHLWGSNGMKQNNEVGSVTSVVTIILLALLLVASIGFGYWAFSSRQDYKNNSDHKAAAAVAAAEASQKAKLQHDFDELAKLPNKTYSGPSIYGTVSFSYPKTWSAYVDQSNSSEPVNAYFYPNIVPGIQSAAAFALRVELVGSEYNQILSQFSAPIKLGTAKAAAYIPPQMVGVTNVQPGMRLDGEVTRNSQGQTQNGSMVIIKVRDKTLQIYTQSKDFLNDFNTTILPSLKFVP